MTMWQCRWSLSWWTAMAHRWPEKTGRKPFPDVQDLGAGHFLVLMEADDVVRIHTARILAVNGGPLSRYGIRTVDGQLCENTGEIIPLSLEEAKKWAENNLNADSYEDLFGKVDE